MFGQNVKNNLAKQIFLEENKLLKEESKSCLQSNWKIQMAYFSTEESKILPTKRNNLDG